MFRYLSTLNSNNGILSSNNWGKLFCLYISSRQKSSLNEEHANIGVLCKELDVSWNVASRLLQTHPRLQEISKEQVIESKAVCQKYGITQNQIVEHPYLLRFRPVTLEHRVLLLKEAGWGKIDPKHILGYINLTSKPVSQLKSYEWLPQDADVTQNFLRHLHEPPANIPPMRSLSDEMDLHTIYMACFRYYICWKLDATPTEVERIINLYRRLKHKSFGFLKRTMDLLQNDIGLSVEKIRRNGFLLHSHPDNTQRILNEVSDIGGLDLIPVLHMYPKIIVTNVETMHKTRAHLERFKISDIAIQKCPEIYTLSSNTVLQRLEYLRTIPSLQVLINNPRALRLVHYQTKARTRLEFLQKLRLKCASLHILSASNKTFVRYAREGTDKTKGRDITLCLKVELRRREDEIHAVLPRHPFWCRIPLLSIKVTLDYLRSQTFSNDDIYQNIHILLYPSDMVKEYLNSFSADDLNAFSKPITKSQRLALCLYNMERFTHFTGDSVWEASTENLTDSAADSHIDTHKLILQKQLGRTEKTQV